MLPDLLLLTVALIWGAGFIVTNLALHSGIPVTLLLTVRFLLPAGVMAVLFRRELASVSLRDLRFGVGAGVILFVAFLSQTWAMRFTTPANCAFLTATNVIMVPFISWLVFRQKPGVRAFVLAFTCCVGAAILSYSPGMGISFHLGDWLSLLCAFCFACHIAYLGLSSDGIRSAAALNFLQLATAGVLSAAAYAFTERQLFSAESFLTGLPYLLYLGLFSTGLCFFLQSWSQRRVPPARTAVILSCEGLFGSLFSVLLGYDKPTLNFAAGGTIILLSVVLLQVDLSQLLRAGGALRRGALLPGAYHNRKG